MADDFNPYHVWLGIQPDEQPANYYRLLSIRLFESSADVIDNAADRQMAHLRTIQVGKHGALSQRLLNEVAAARICLLDPKKRAAYNQQLRARLLATAPAAEAVVEAAPSSGGSAVRRQLPSRPADGAPANPRPATAPSAAPSKSSTDAGIAWDDLLGDTSGKSHPHPAAATSNAAASKSSGSRAAASKQQPAQKIAAKRPTTNLKIAVGIAAGVVLAAVAGIVLLATSGSSPTSGNTGTLVFDWPDAYRSDTTITLDNAPITIPTNGPRELQCSPGQHHIVALHSVFKLDHSLSVAVGDRQKVSSDWKPRAILVLNWPLESRVGASLAVDDRVQTPSQTVPLEIPVLPGRHTVQVTRPGFTAIGSEVNVAADGRASVDIAPFPTTATLVFDWPSNQRQGAELTIDGLSKTDVVGAVAPSPEVTLEPGRHVVVINRPGFEPFHESIDLSAGTAESIRPIWTRRWAAPAVAETPVPEQTAPPANAPPESPTPTPNKKIAPPTAAEQEQIAKQLDDLYKTSHAGAKDLAKAQELFDIAAKDARAPAERYMLLMKGAEIAATAGDLNLSLQGIDTLDADYEIDALDLKQKLLDRFVISAKPTQLADAIPTAEQLIDRAVQLDRYETALVLATTVGRMATKSQVANHKEIEDRLSRRRHDIHLIEPIYAAAKKAQEALEKTPADPGANSTAGRWRCLYKSDWQGGLPLLAIGSDEKLKSLAAAELKAPTDADQQVKLADAWWDMAAKEAGPARDSLRLHAGDLYQAAIPNLASELKKATIQKRLAEIASLKATVASNTAAASNAAASGKPADGKFPLKQWVDVLRLVDRKTKAVTGTWERHGSDVVVNPGATSRMPIPVEVDGGYDFELEFTRVSGDDAIAVILPIGSHSARLILAGFEGRVSGFDNIDHMTAAFPENPTSVRPGQIENNHRYRLTVSVRLASADRASVDVSLDGKPYLPHWQGSPDKFFKNPYWSMPEEHQLGIGANESAVEFHSARLRMASGSASSASTGDSVANSGAGPAGLPPAANGQNGNAKFPLNQWFDVLRILDPKRLVFCGVWSRQNESIVAARSSAARLVVPIIPEGGYDFEMEFTRNSGDSDVGAMFPVGSHSCMLVISANRGDVSGLQNVDGLPFVSEQNPTTIRPGRLENGRRYKLLAAVRVLSDEQASVDISLDGKPYLPHWEGNPASLSPSHDWRMPNPQTLGLAAYSSEVVFHSARLRMVSGHASLDPALDLNSAPSRPTIVSARWGSGTSWMDVTDLVTKTVADSQTVYANAVFLRADPVADQRRQLEVKFVQGERKFLRTIPEGAWWPNYIYANPK